LNATAEHPIDRQAAAAQLLLNRRQARTSMAAWARVNGFEPARHHLFLIDKLEKVVRGEIRRLAIFMPPGSAKSTYSSDLFPPWFLAQRPQSNILTASHSADLAAMFGRRARNRIVDNPNVLGYTLRKDSQAADEWSTTHGGVFFCAGVGGKIAGRRADLGLIDDPIGLKEDAYSKVVRDKIWEWFKYDFRTRLKPGASIVLIQTRWHEEDLAGMILKTERDEWDIVNLPMLAKDNDPLGRQPGEMLWSEYFDPQILKDAQKDAMTFSALYQQDPTPQDGNYFRRAWVEDNSYDNDQLPDLTECRLYCTSDHAVSLKEDADSTVMLPFAVDPQGTIWILPDVIWDKFDTLDAVNYMIGKMQKYKPITWWAESEKIEKSIGPFLQLAMREKGVYCYVDPIHPAKDKQTRAQSIRGRMASGMVRFPRQATWYANGLSELLKFPAGAHDDFVDALAYVGLGLDRMGRGIATPTIVDVNQYLIPKPLTLGSIKHGDERSARRKQLLLLGN
jgi:predicted phage terminase large subunit-like protein